MDSPKAKIMQHVTCNTLYTYSPDSFCSYNTGESTSATIRISVREICKWVVPCRSTTSLKYEDEDFSAVEKILCIEDVHAKTLSTVDRVFSSLVSSTEKFVDPGVREHVKDQILTVMNNCARETEKCRPKFIDIFANIYLVTTRVFGLVVEGTRKRAREDVESEANDVCPICRDRLSLDRPVSLFCSHDFHFPCILKWIKSHNSCPVCRRKVGTL